LKGQELKDFQEATLKTKGSLKELKTGKVLGEAEYFNLSARFPNVFEAGSGAEAVRKLLERVDLKKLAIKTKEEIEKLLEVCKESKSPHLYPVTLFALSSGARRGEILGLKWKDVDLDRKVATFRDTKNGEHRSIPLSDALSECLWKEKRLRSIPSEYVFPSIDGKMPADIRGAWENAVEKAGLSGVCFHTLRHTVASHLTMGGASMIEVGAILGHKTLAMVKRYSHLSVTATAKVLGRMNEEVLGKAGNGI